MFFRNLIFFRLPANWAMTAERLADSLSKLAFQPSSALETERHGWVPPVRHGGLVHAVQNQWLVALRMEKKLLPNPVVKQITEEKAQELEEQQGFRPGRKQLRELKQRVFEELLPKAFVTQRTLYAWIDPVNGWFAVDTSSRARAEDLISALRQCVEDFPLSVVRTQLSPASAMTGWLASGESPAGFTVDRDCELMRPNEEKSVVRYVRHPLEGEEVRGHIADGKIATRLAMTWDDRLSFVLTDGLEVKRLAFLDIIKEQAETQADSADDDAEFLLNAGELCRFLPDLIEALGGEEKEEG